MQTPGPDPRFPHPELLSSLPCLTLPCDITQGGLPLAPPRSSLSARPAGPPSEHPGCAHLSRLRHHCHLCAVLSLPAHLSTPRLPSTQQRDRGMRLDLRHSSSRPARSRAPPRTPSPPESSCPSRLPRPEAQLLGSRPPWAVRPLSLLPGLLLRHVLHGPLHTLQALAHGLPPQAHPGPGGWHGRPPLTCIAPMFSISWSALEAPRSTELTPSFLRHQAGGSKTE